MEEGALKARGNMRKNIYVDLYGYTEYKWTSESSASNRADDWDGRMDIPEEADNMGTTGLPKYEHKSFVPATPMDVDSPLPIAGLKEPPLG